MKKAAPELTQNDQTQANGTAKPADDTASDAHSYRLSQAERLIAEWRALQETRRARAAWKARCHD